MSKLIIVGSSHAGVQAATAARTAGYEGQILLFGKEDTLPYHRPPLSKGFLLGEQQAGDILLRPESFYEHIDVTLALGEEVVSLDLGTRHVITQKGGSYAFDKLVLATGAANTLLPGISGAADGVVSLRTMADALLLKEKMQQSQKAVIIGGGFIGLELAACFNQQGIIVDVIESSCLLAQRVFSTHLAQYMMQVHQNRGNQLHFNTTVTEVFKKDNQVTGVRLSTGEELSADLVVVAVGSQPSLGLLQGTVLLQAQGVAVDVHAQTEVPGVYAVGDCASAPVRIDSSTERRLRLESVHAANDLGKVAGARVVGKQAAFTSVPWFWSDQFDLKLQMAGVAQSSDEVIIRGLQEENTFSLFHFKSASDELVAVQCVNKAADFVQGRRLLEQRARLDKTQIADSSIPLRELVVEAE